MNKEELLRAAVEAHEIVERDQARRRSAFRRALSGPVSLRELANATGLTVGKVRGVRGQ